MSDLISKQDTLDCISKHFVEPALTQLERYYNWGIDDAMEEVIKLPSAEKRGRWKKLIAVPQTESLYMGECSKCGSMSYATTYCGACGVRMGEE